MIEHAGAEGGASVAIVGMAGRFPGARNIEAFWRNLCGGVESIRFFSPEELRASGVSPEEIRHPNYVNAKGMLEDADLFDAAFFGINPREAEVIDPQHRVFLQCAWEALEAAGYDPGHYEGSIGVYAGGGMSSYYLSCIMGNDGLINTVGPYQVMLGNDKDYLASRVSYKLNLKGPSVVVQTACSTSLVAVQTAYQSLLNYQCDMALAGGVSIGFPQKTGYRYFEGMILSPDGHCRAFDAKAKGTLPGEGVGIVVLKRLEDAITAGDHIHAVIRGAAINNDGSSKIGYTAPSVEGQAEVITMALSIAGVPPDTIGYVEAHGTGTPLGDPIEVAGLTQAFRMQTVRSGFCALGSVKTNIGHLDAAAGVAGLIKAALVLERRRIPPSLHFQAPNPEIDFANSPFYVNTALSDFKEGTAPRRAGVSSFGMGGTNAHVVLEEAPPRPSKRSHRRHQLLLLSARTPEALETATDDLAACLENASDLDLADAAFTLHVGRRPFSQARIVACGDREEGARLLKARDRERVFSGERADGKRPVVFLLTGQGAQYVDMARGLYEEEPVYRRVIDDCSRKLERALGFDLRTVLYPEPGRVEEAGERLRQTSLTQPAVFAVDYALATMWMSWGIRPEALLGHSLGEYVAGCLAGVFPLDEALELVAERGRLMQSLPEGSMLALPLAADEAKRTIGAELSLAAVNAPRLCVVSGPHDAIETLQKRLEREGLQVQRLRTSHAFHSAMMDPIIDAFVAKVAAVPLRPPKLPILSNLTGRWLTPEEATDPMYWGRHLRNPVLFSDAVALLLAGPDRVLLEVGPGQTLVSLARQQAAPPGKHAMFSTVSRSHNLGSDGNYLQTTLGRLWLAGVDVDWAAVHADEERRRVAIPTYPFQRDRYFVESARSVRKDDHPKRGEVKKIPDISRWFYVPSWRRTAPSGSTPAPGAREGTENWLVCLDDLGVGREIAGRLLDAGDNVTSVAAGEGFSRTGEDGYTIDPGSRADYDALFRDLSLRNRIPSRLLHFFSLTGKHGASRAETSSEAMKNKGFYSLLFAAQAFTSAQPGVPLRIDVISNRTQDVGGNETVDPDKALLFGPCRVMSQEFDNLSCRNIDIDVRDDVVAPDGASVSRIHAEISADPSDPVVALRGDQRWVQHFEPLLLPPRATGQRFRDRGVYLIVGGLGSIGLSVARHIAGNVRARLVLTGRTLLSPHAPGIARNEAEECDRKRMDRAAAVREIEESGSEVLVIRADAACEEDMRGVMRKIHDTYGELNGVIHAAGITSFNGMTELDRVSCERQFSAMVTGIRLLDGLLRGKTPDFCVISSSLSSMLGGIGNAALSAAAGFMDAFAHERNRSADFPWIAIDWDAWLPAREIGRTGVPELTMIPDEGVEAFARALAAQSLKHVIVSTGDLDARANLWIRRTGLSRRADPQEGKIGTLHARPNVSTLFTAPGTELETTIAKIWQDLLGVGQVGIGDNFFELGGHSLLATQFLSRLRDTLGVEIPMRSVFEAPTVGEMAALVGGIRVPEIKATSAEEVAAEKERSPLVPIQAKGVLPPFFGIPGHNGDVFCFIHLARHLGEERPFFAFQPPGFEGECKPIATVEELAGYYVKELRAFLPEGPYLLGGYCAGGTVAFEMAQQLRKAGSDVGLLVLFDSPCPTVYRPAKMLLTVLRYLRYRIPHHLAKIVKGEARNPFRYVWDRWRGFSERVRGGALDERYVAVGNDARERVARVTFDAVKVYRPREYPGIMHFIAASNLSLRQNYGDQKKWGSFALGGVRIQEGPEGCTGDWMLREPYVEFTAGLLRKCLDEAGNPTAGCSR